MNNELPKSCAPRVYGMFRAALNSWMKCTKMCEHRKTFYLDRPANLISSAHTTNHCK